MNSTADTYTDNPARAQAAVAPTRANICAVVVTYQPDKELADRLARIVPQVAAVVIVDNESKPEIRSNLVRISREFGAALLQNEENLGVATALNQGFKWARENKFEWMLTLDQDSIPVPEMVQLLCAAYADYDQRAKLAVIGSNYLPTEHATEPEYDHTIGRSGSCWVEAHETITSGSLIALRALEELGPFEDDLFIDSVDHEFCLRARRRGWKVIISLPVGMRHFLGEPERRRFLWKQVTPSHHSPLRQYYMARNRAIMCWRYFFFDPRWAVMLLRVLALTPLFIVLYERQKWQKLAAFNLGLLHAAFGRRGKLNRTWA